MNAGALIATILRHDKKVASYKIALIRSLNDIVLGYPQLGTQHAAIAVPLQMLARFWLAYYWPFVNPLGEIKQARQAEGKQDISFRPGLSALYQEWEKLVGASRPSDGFYLVGEFASEHRRKSYPSELISSFSTAVEQVVDAIQQPIRYAGSGEYSVFERPKRWSQLHTEKPGAVCVPGTLERDLCVVVDPELWQSFCELSLWIEALCIHEWCLFTQSVAGVERGLVYGLLTDRPDNRRPLTWERNQVEILMLEGSVFECPWTGKTLHPDNYDIDHLLPISIYPLNELWNLVPAEREFNQHIKRDRMPGHDRLENARPRLVQIYQHYLAASELAAVLRQDARMRFSENVVSTEFPELLARNVSGFLSIVAESRSLSVF
jgi:hypothetical protein